MKTESKYYGVSSGDGNNGVSQLFPDYIVKTDDPWKLAKLAAISTFKEGKGQEWAKENMEIDGDEEHAIYVTFLESPEQQEEREKAQGAFENEESDEDPSNWDATAWLIFEIFPLDGRDVRTENRPVYESIEEAL